VAQLGRAPGSGPGGRGFKSHQPDVSLVILGHHIAPIESSVVTQPNSAVSTSSHTNQVLELLRKLMEYRSDEIRQRLEKVRRAASMLYTDVLLLIYHFARFSPGNILEIGPYVGGSTIAAAFGARESGTRRKSSVLRPEEG
jgi:hypothetical protein